MLRSALCLYRVNMEIFWARGLAITGMTPKSWNTRRVSSKGLVKGFIHGAVVAAERGEPCATRWVLPLNSGASLRIIVRPQHVGSVLVEEKKGSSVVNNKGVQLTGIY